MPRKATPAFSKKRKSRELHFDDITVNITITETSRTKKLHLAVAGGQIGQATMTVPRRTTEKNIDEFIAQNRKWIHHHSSRHFQRVSKLGLLKSGFVWREGQPLTLVRSRGERSLARVGKLNSQAVLAVSGPLDKAPGAIEKWCREELRRIVSEIIDEEAPGLRVRVEQIRIADQKTRWGSASTTGTLSFSWRLLLAPREVIDYVVIHELCHLREMNHSKRFWAHVENLRPGWREQKEWLAQNGAEIRAWSPEIATGAKRLVR